MLTVDSNILVYSFDDRDANRQAVARDVLRALKLSRSPIGLQVIGETFRVTTGKLRMPKPQMALVLAGIAQTWPLFSADQQTTLRAMSLAAAGRLSFWDANLLSAAEAAGCRHLFSEDMADGYRLGQIEIVNPFAADGLSARARDLLSS